MNAIIAKLATIASVLQIKIRTFIGINFFMRSIVKFTLYLVPICTNILQQLAWSGPEMI